MIVCVSIVDKHRPKGDRHVGTYHFEIDYPADSHFDFLTTWVILQEDEETFRPLLNKLLQGNEIPGAIRGDGSQL